jgi:hypothetical protein
MVRIAPEDAGGIDKSNQDSPEDDDSDGPNVVRAQMGTIRAGLSEQGGDQNIANDAFAAAGTTPDAVVTQDDDSPNVVAEGGSLDSPTVSIEEQRADVIVGTPEGGAAVQTKGDEVVGLGPGSNKLSSLGDSSPGDDSSPSTTSEGDSNSSTMWGGDNRSTDQVVEQARQRLGAGGGTSGGFGGFGSGQGGLMNMLTSPVGIVLLVSLSVLATFLATDDGGDNGEQ